MLKTVLNCEKHKQPVLPETTGCTYCFLESRLSIPKKAQGRPYVGVWCEQRNHCINQKQCQESYNQDFMNADGSCPHFSQQNG